MEEGIDVFTKLPLEENYKAYYEFFKKKKMLSILEDWNTVDKRFMLFEFFSKGDLINEKLFLLATDRDYKVYLKKRKDEELVKIKKEKDFLKRIGKLKENNQKSPNKKVKENNTSQTIKTRESPRKKEKSSNKIDYCDTLTTLKNLIKSQGENKIPKKNIEFINVKSPAQSFKINKDTLIKSFKSSKISINNMSLRKSKSLINPEKKFKQRIMSSGSIISLKKIPENYNFSPEMNKKLLKSNIPDCNKMSLIDLSTISFDTTNHKKQSIPFNEVKKKDFSVKNERKTLNKTKSEITFKSILKEFIKDPFCRKMEKSNKSKEKVSERLAHSINSFFLWKKEQKNDKKK
jgi:hypothetical protein